ncbi:MAG: UvrD-helicase domain-containing protein, partial [Pirellulales bacterium]|nr:UvrD-helicase domain-containing protein [Pirellulales bacterium]
LCTEQILSEHLKVRREEAGRFDHVLIDEYQDTNGSQYRIVRHLAAAHQNLCVVGDDDQSIYGWRGADVTHILRFNKDWPRAKVVRLEDNYRSTEAILSLANRLIRFNAQRHDKTLRAARRGGEKPPILQYENETTEAEEVVADIARRLKEPRNQPRDFAILFRTNEQPRAFETQLRRANLPYVLVGGMSFFDRKEVRDLMAYFKLIANPRDEVSLLRIINTPPRGISQKAVRTLLDHATQQGKPLWDIIKAGRHVPGVSDNAHAATQRFREFIEDAAQQFESGNLVDSVRTFIERTGYEREIERLYTDPNERQSRLDAVEEVVNAVGEYQQKRRSKASLRGFLDDMALSDRDTNDDKDKQLARNAIVLMTYHSSKGLEFPQVYMVGMEENLLPHHRAVAAEGAAIDEERRLCYVGITRAQERLTMSLALSRTKWGKPRPTIASRFLFELTGQADGGEDDAAPRTRVDAKGKRSGSRRKTASDVRPNAARR